MFRVATDADDAAPPAVELTAASVARLREQLRADSARTGLTLLDPDEHGGRLPARFEARVCPSALASLAAVLDYDPAAIAVFEEAQFRGRRVVVRRSRRSFVMEVSLASDEGVELDLASGNAYALLESLGLAPDRVGEATIEEVRRRLANPAVQRRMREQNVARYADRLTRLLASARHDHSSRFEWA